MKFSWNSHEILKTKLISDSDEMKVQLCLWFEYDTKSITQGGDNVIWLGRKMCEAI